MQVKTFKKLKEFKHTRRRRLHLCADACVTCHTLMRVSHVTRVRVRGKGGGGGEGGGEGGKVRRKRTNDAVVNNICPL